MKATWTLWWPRLLLAIPTVLLPIRCSLFETRTPAPPTQASLDFQPASDAPTVISNLENAIAQKSSENYIRCFADPSRNRRGFTFIPSAEGLAQYPGLLANWTIDDELGYIRNLIAKSPPNGFSSLLLSLRSSVVTADSVVYNYDYTLTFEHTEAGFPMTARGTLQFSLGTDNTNSWTIFRWSDFKTSNDITWSLVKGKFSN